MALEKEPRCTLSLSMEQSLKDKLSYLAWRDHRTLTGEARQFIRRSIRTYEELVGPIGPAQLLEQRRAQDPPRKTGPAPT